MDGERLVVGEVGRRWRSVGDRVRGWLFFFQAEDGIRDYKVTGVQTCALPIYPHPKGPGFFVWEGGDRLIYDSVNRWFLLVACQIGLRKPGDRRGPRLHDLRHYFAIRTLLNWYRSNADAEAHLPELATYLGHVHVRDSYWYLSATPELLKLATLRWQRNEK